MSVYVYDLQSAFPSQAIKLYNFKYAKFAKLDYIDQTANWGWLKGEVTINDDVMVHPIVSGIGGGNLGCPTGTWEDIRLLDEIKFIYKWQIGSFKLTEGWFIKFTAPVKPYEIPLTRLFKLRARNEMANNLAKRMATGCYGISYEKHDDGRVGDYYNPLYGNMINIPTNLQVCEFLYSNGIGATDNAGYKHLIHIGVDSVMLDCPIEECRREWFARLKKQGKPLPPFSNNHLKNMGKSGMGNWKLAYVGSAIVLSSGRVYYGDKHPQGLKYNDIISMIEAKPNEHYYATKLQKRQTLAECIELGSLKGLGEMKETSTSLDLNTLRATRDRKFEGYPRTGRELLNKKYSSRPIRIGDGNKV